MTAEVALLNRTAVALAADSATTVTYWEKGEAQTRYFKGANKIFNISDHFPVGLMIYDAGILQGVPWEVIAKAYRDTRGSAPHDELTGYARSFFDFIVSDNHLFPRQLQELQVVSALIDVVLRICRVITPPEEIKEPERRVALIKERFARFKQVIEEEKYLDDINQEFVRQKMPPFKDHVMQAVQKQTIFEEVQNHIPFDELFELAGTALVKKQWTTLQTTGLVFAGYGQKQYFPQLEQYTTYGILLGTLICERTVDRVVINHDNVSEIVPLAQSEMAYTFMYGASMSVLQHIDKLLQESFDLLIKELTDHGHISQDAAAAAVEKKEVPFSAERKAASDKFSSALTVHLFTEHSVPLRNVIGMLPVDELAELAETLISIESLKERVTRPSQSVSGPIDVAVISKSDGFVWIKRKHYFDPKLNPRFFARKQLSRER